MKKRLLLLVTGVAVPLLGMEPTQANKQQKKTWSKNTTQFLSYFTHCALKDSSYKKALEELEKLGFTFKLNDQNCHATMEKILLDTMLPACIKALKYRQNVRPIIDTFAELGIESAIQEKFETVCYDFNKKDYAQAKELIEQQIELGKKYAFELKLEGLNNGLYNYTKDRDEAYRIIEQQIKLGKDWAVNKKIEGLTFGSYGYEFDPNEARSLLDKQAALGKDWAVNKKIEGLTYGSYGYESDLNAARSLLDEQAALGNDWAFRKKINELWFVYCSDERNDNTRRALRELNEQFVALGNDMAIEYKHRGLHLELYGYDENKDEADRFLNEQVSSGSKYAIKEKIRANSELPEKLLPILQTLAEEVFAKPKGLITLLEVEDRTKFKEKKA